MGVDIATYRCRIGCFSGNCGSNNVLTVILCPRFTDWIKAVGSVMFISTLLLIAGIESNPGPLPGGLGTTRKAVAISHVVCDISDKTKTADQYPEIPETEVTIPRPLETTDARAPGRGRRLRKRKITTCKDKKRDGKRKRLSRADRGTSPPNICHETLDEQGTEGLPLLTERPSSSGTRATRKHVAISHVVCDISGKRKTADPFPISLPSAIDVTIPRPLKSTDGMVPGRGKELRKRKITVCEDQKQDGKRKRLSRTDQGTSPKIICNETLDEQGTERLPLLAERPPSSGKHAVTRSEINAHTETSVLNLASPALKKNTCTCNYYVVSVQCWPRIYKSQQVIKDFVERCSYFENMFGLQGQQQKDLLEIHIYIDSNVDVELTSLLVRCGKYEEKGTVYLNVSKRNTSEKSFSLGEKFSGIFIDKEGVKLAEAVSSEQIGEVVAYSVHNESTDKQPHQFDLLRAKHELVSLLEITVFEILTTKYNNLKQLYETRMHEPFKDETDDSNESSASKLIKKHKDDVEQLLGEMTAFFKRSTLPENKRPVGLRFEKKEVSKEMKEQLFGLDKTIRGCGYSHTTFNVNVERLSDEEEHMSRQKRITDFLESNGITNIKFNIVSKSVAEYKRVGARISVPKTAEPTVYHKGTLGGFASFSNDKDNFSCALFSRHLALGCSSKLYVDGKNGQPTELGEILENTLQQGSYDIAAAKIHDHLVQHCNVQFKNTENDPLPGKLYTQRSSIDLQDLHVHLWGSVSTPGRGIIKVPKLDYPETSDTYMEIEDRNPSKRMAVEGDSGAIVCADDLDDEYVHVISMLIGSNSDTTTLQDPNVKRTYIAFPVQEGVERLQMKTGGTFSLKGVSND